MKITEVLARRTDLSTFLVHLTRATPDARSAKQNLINIIDANSLKASSPFGMAYRTLQDLHLPTDSQNCVCFTETPLNT